MTEATPQTAVTSAGTAPVKATVSEGTEYVILKRADGKDAWNRVNTATARTGDQAIRDVVDKLADADQSGLFVAVPFRSWKPVTVRKQTVTTLNLEEAK